MSNKLEDTFLTCLKEIEVRYTVLPKSVRLRIERWIEKLIVVGKNDVWKKDRNMYCRLLLSMVLSKTFSEPFHTAPPDGSLPPFPSYLKGKLKNVAGPHESFFWRDVYGRLVPASAEDLTPPPQPYPVDLASNISLDPDQKETYNLRQLIAEQSRRIEILEKQMYEERLQHEEEIQRFLQHHKSEMERMKQTYTRRKHQHVDPAYSVNRSRLHQSYDSFVHSTARTPQSQHIPPSRQTRTTTGDMHRSFETKSLSPPASHSFSEEERDRSDLAHSTLTATPATTTATATALERTKENIDSNSSFRSARKQSPPISIYDRPRAPPIPPAASSASTPLPSPLSANTMTRSVLDTPHADIAPSLPRPKPSADISPQRTLNRSNIGDSSRPLSTVKFDIRPGMPVPVSYDVDEEEESVQHFSTSQSKDKKELSSGGDSIFSRDIPEDDSDFMSYLEEFQNEIRGLQFNVAQNTQYK